MAEDMNTPWTARRDDSGGEPGLWSVVDASGAVVFFGMSEKVARLLAGAPDLLAAATEAYEHAGLHTADCERVTTYEEEAIFEDTTGCTCFLSRLHAAIVKASAAPKQPGAT